MTRNEENPPVRKRWGRRIVISFLVLLLALGCSELLLRGVGLGNPLLIQRDSAAGYIIEPNQSVHRFGGHTHTNAYGMRSDDLPPTKRAGVFRIMFVGDSFTYGTTQVDQKQIFAEILQQELPARIHQPVEVLNASAGGWAIGNEVGFVRSRGLFDADLVMLVLNQGDPNQPFEPYNPVDPHTYSVDYHPRFALQELWEHYFAPRIFPPKPDPTPPPTAGELQQIAARNLAYLDELLALTRAAHTRLAITYIPAPTYPDSPASLIGWCAKNSVPLINLTPAAVKWPPNEVQIYDHVHYNTKGNRLIADELEKDWPAVMPASTPVPAGADSAHR